MTSPRKPRRSKKEIWAVYQQYLQLTAKGHTKAAISRKLGIYHSTLSTWDKNPPKLSQIDKAIGKVINGFEILRQTEHGKVNTRCTKCNIVRSKGFDYLKKNKVKCEGCNPVHSKVYATDIRDLYLDGHTAPQIAEILDIGITSVYPIVNLVKKELGIVIQEEEFTMREIAEYLNLSEYLVDIAYKSGMEKIKKYLEEKDDFKDLY